MNCRCFEREVDTQHRPQHPAIGSGAGRFLAGTPMTTYTADEARAKAASTYNAAADSFDGAANTFCDRFGRRTVARLDLRPGARVLDVCCGTGASAIPAAEKVGSSGSVIGVDL